jgi:hypothetical protein
MTSFELSANGARDGASWLKRAAGIGATRANGTPANGRETIWLSKTAVGIPLSTDGRNDGLLGKIITNDPATARQNGFTFPIGRSVLVCKSIRDGPETPLHGGARRRQQVCTSTYKKLDKTRGIRYAHRSGGRER